MLSVEVNGINRSENLKMCLKSEISEDWHNYYDTSNKKGTTTLERSRQTCLLSTKAQHP